ncbi:MAG: mechanosensitive ion channel family protein [Puniceicoccaceae bacterium]|nr:MAG: mechanosensitive ion channel family protein [Puniceicoccaceae bacterium]
MADWLTREYVFGNFTITPLSVLVGFLLLLLVSVLASFVKKLLAQRLLPRAGLSVGVANAVGSLAGYFILLVGILSILPVMLPGFNFATLTLILGALSFGIGFGLRNVADNFVSGLILLLERPVKVGDRIVVGDLEGSVVDIRARSTTVRTNDNIDIIVPNAEFVSGRVTNLSHNDNRVRFKMPVGVHYNSDVHLVEKALLEAAAAAPHVLKQPAPAARFLAFGDSALEFELRVWSDTLFEKPNALRSEVNFLIWEMFKKYGIQIPYPQRDLHVKEWPGGKPVTVLTEN